MELVVIIAGHWLSLCCKIRNKIETFLVSWECSSENLYCNIFDQICADPIKILLLLLMMMMSMVMMKMTTMLIMKVLM